MTQQQIKNIFFIGISLFLSFCDILLFSIQQHHFILIMHCWIIILLSRKIVPELLILPIFLLSLQSYLDDNMFGSCLLYIMPGLLLAEYLEEHLQITTVIPYILLAQTLLIKKGCWAYLHIAHYSWIYIIYLFAYNCLCIKMLMIIYKYIIKKIDKP